MHDLDEFELFWGLGLDSFRIPPWLFKPFLKNRVLSCPIGLSKVRPGKMAIFSYNVCKRVEIKQVGVVLTG